MLGNPVQVGAAGKETFGRTTEAAVTRLPESIIHLYLQRVEGPVKNCSTRDVMPIAAACHSFKDHRSFHPV